MIKIRICVAITKKMIFNNRKIKYVFICFKRMKKIFLRREFHSFFKFMKHDLYKTNTNTIMFNLFLYFKNLHVLKNQICI